MEWEKKSKESPPAFKHLVEQVDEQSELCDLTVKVGHWEKKFHRCVLAACPYFKTIIMGNFIEKKTGMVEIKHDTTSNNVDMALMFLYGRKPDITSGNVGGLLELAEYFMIKGLKSTCIEWLRLLDITDNNCMWLMQLCSKYNFEVKVCIKYIESHLHEVFQNEEAVNLSQDSVEYLFSDRRFTYVTNDEKLTFLVKWVNKNIDEKSANIIALFKTIDMQEVSQPALESAKSNVKFNEIINLDQTICMTTNEITRHNVLILFSHQYQSLCFDLHTDRCYRLNSRTLEDIYFHNKENFGVRDSGPETYFTECVRYSKQNRLQIKIYSLNLETDKTKTYKFDLEPEETTEKCILRDYQELIHFADDTVLATFNIMVPIIQNSENKQTESTQLTRDIANHLPHFIVGDLDKDKEVKIQELETEDNLLLPSTNLPQNRDVLSASFEISPLLSTSSRNQLQALETPSSFDIIMPQSLTYSLIEQQKEGLATTSRRPDLETETSDDIAQHGDVFTSKTRTMIQQHEELPSTSRETDKITGTSQSTYIGSVPQTGAFPPGSCRNENQNVRLIRHSEVYVGHVSEEISKMLPLFTLRNEHIVEACMNNHSTIALLTKSLKRVFLFDMRNFKMEQIVLEAIEDGGYYKLVPTDIGFKIYNSKRCYSITRSATSENQLTEFMFENEEDGYVRYHYFNGIWIKLLRHQNNDDVKLYCIDDALLQRSNTMKDIIWKPFNLPDNMYSFDDFGEIVMILLSKSRLRCDIECPHCEISAPRHVPELWDFIHMFLRHPSDSNNGSSYFGDSD